MEEIKGGMPIQKLYDTINTLTGTKFTNNGFIPMQDQNIKYHTIDATTIQAKNFEGPGILNKGFTVYTDQSPDETIETKNSSVHIFQAKQIGRFGVVNINPRSNALLSQIILKGSLGEEKVFKQEKILMGGTLATRLFPGCEMLFILNEDQTTLTFIGGAPTGTYLTESGGIVRGNLIFYDGNARTIALQAHGGVIEAEKISANIEKDNGIVKVGRIELPNKTGKSTTLTNSIVETDIIKSNKAEIQALVANNFENKENFILGTGTVNGSMNILGSLNTKDINSDGTIRGTKVYGAVYNDYAEFFPRGEESEPGDIIALNIYADDEEYCKGRAGLPIVGVHSDEYACLIGGENPTTDDPDAYIKENIEHYIPVSLAGRVYTKVIGSVKKGDKLYASSIPGVATTEKNGSSFGIAVENSDKDEIKKIKVLMRG